MLATLQMDPTNTETPVARLVGEVDASNARGFTNQLKDGVPNIAIGLVLDLTETSYIDSSGLHMIVELGDALRRRQQTLQLVVAPETFVEDVLAAVNLTAAVRISPTLPEALEAVREPAF